MKIVACSMVRNEEATIESNARYALTICDYVIYCDHKSTDCTRTIIEALQEETDGRVRLIDLGPLTIEFKQNQVMNQLAAYAFDVLGAELLLPLDADEFPFVTDGRPVRECLEGLDLKQAYHMSWCVVLPVERYIVGRYLPVQFGRAMPLDENTVMSKVIVSRDFYRDHKAWITIGQHGLMDGNTHSLCQTISTAPGLWLGHFAIRDAEHFKNKVVLGRLSMRMRPDYVDGQGRHTEDGYQRCKAGADISDWLDAWTVWSSNPKCPFESYDFDKQKIEEFPAEKYFGHIELKYTEKVAGHPSHYAALLETAEEMAVEYSQLSQEKIALTVAEQADQLRIADLEKDVADLEAYSAELIWLRRRTEENAERLEQEKSALERALQIQVAEKQEILQSNSWKVTKPLRKVKDLKRKAEKARRKKT